MRLRNVKNKQNILENSSIFIENPEQHIGNWRAVFGNNHEIHLEIGMGKGKFLIQMAMRYPDINFIGIEKYDSVLVRALEKVDFLPNLRIVRMNALTIEQCFLHEISKLYLNFSDPWPKKRHHERRLTSFSFLQKYDSIFFSDAKIIQKTDNRELFEYSLLSFSKYGYTLEEISLDLYQQENLSWNVSTEYEERFCKLGYPIYYVSVSKNCK